MRTVKALTIIACLASPMASHAAPTKKNIRETRITPRSYLLAVAHRALAPNDPWHLKPWQRSGYQKIAAGKFRLTRVDQTCYGSWEGQTLATASGARCSTKTLACNRLTMGTMVFIWPGHLRVVQDTGSHKNDRVADRHGSEFWVDVFTPSRVWKDLSNEWYVRKQVAVIY